MAGLREVGRRVTNWLLLREEQETLRSVWADTPEAATLYRLYVQHAESADVLWSQGLTADALRLAKMALENLNELLGMYLSHDGDRPVKPNVRKDFEATLQEFESGLPRLDSEVQERHEQLIESARSRSARLARGLRWFAQNPKDLKSRVRWRVGGLVFALLALCGVAAYFLRPPPDAAISASGAITDPTTTYSADRAHDGDPTTEWLGENSPGFWEVRFRSSRQIREIEILNGVNASLYDRGVQDYEVEFYNGGTKVHATRGHLEQVQQPAPVRLPGTASPIDRIRVVIHSHYGHGPALAEVTWR